MLIATHEDYGSVELENDVLRFINEAEQCPINLSSDPEIPKTLIQNLMFALGRISEQPYMTMLTENEQIDFKAYSWEKLIGMDVFIRDEQGTKVCNVFLSISDTEGLILTLLPYIL